MSTTVTYKGNTLTTATNETKTLLTSGKYMEDDVTITDASPTFTTQTKSRTVSALPGGTQVFHIHPDAGYDGLSQVDFTVNAISYGTEGTPTATKGAVSDNAITVTPKVVNTAGYISGGTKTGTAVSVSASELVSGSETKTANGTYDVTNLAELAVAVPWIWESPSPMEFVKTCHDSKFKLNATTYDSWTASTTAGKILASASATSTFTADIANYDYLVRWRYQIVPVYTSGATLKAMPIQESQIMYQFITRRPSNVANMGSETYNYNVCLSLYTIPYLEYYNTSGTESVTFSTSYGIYGSVQAAALSSTSADSITVTPKTMQLNARCNSSYFATGRKAQIDSANTYIREICDVYKLARPSAYRSMVAEMIDLRNNPIVT